MNATGYVSKKKIDKYKPRTIMIINWPKIIILFFPLELQSTNTQGLKWHRSVVLTVLREINIHSSLSIFKYSLNYIWFITKKIDEIYFKAKCPRRLLMKHELCMYTIWNTSYACIRHEIIIETKIWNVTTHRLRKGTLVTSKSKL